MSKFWKIIGGLAILMGVLVVTLVVLVKLFVTPERIKAIVLPLAEQKLHRQISLGEVKVGLFSGIELHTLSVSETGETEPFIAAERAVLRFQLLPLLSRRVVIDEVTLERPLIRVIRKADGSFNFSDLLAARAETAANAPRSPAAAEPAPSLSVLVAVAQVRDGRLSFIDRQVGATTELSELKLDSTGITLDGTIPVRLSAKVQGASLQVDGEWRPLLKGGTFKADLQGLDFVAFEPYYRSKIPGKLSRLLLDLQGEFDLRGDMVAAKGKLAARELNLLLLTLPTTPLQELQINADYNLALDLERDQLTVTSLTVVCNGLAGQLHGEITNLTKDPKGELTLSIPPMDLAMLTKSLPRNVLDKVARLDLSGTLQASVRLTGRFDQPLRMLHSGEATLDQVQFAAGGQHPAISGRLKLASEQMVSEGLTVTLGDNRANLKVTGRNLFDRPLVVTADVTAPRFLIEPLLQGSGAAAVAAGSGQPSGAAAKPDVVGPFDWPVQASGTVRVGEAIWKGMSIRDFQVDYLLRDNQLTISRMAGSTAGGSFSNTARVDLRQPGLVYGATINLQSFQADPLLSAVAPQAAGSLHGTMTLQGNLDGRGTHWDTFSRSLSGDIALAVADGRLVSPALVKGLAAFLHIPDLNEIAFSDVRGKVKLVAGKADVVGTIRSSHMQLFPKGTVGLDGSLNLALDTRISPELTARIDQRGRVTRYLLDNDGWSQVPLLVTGTLDAPRYGLDPKGFQAQGTKVLQQELQRGLDKLLQKSPPPAKEAPADQSQPSAEPEQPPANPTQQLLEDSLKRMLRR